MILSKVLSESKIFGKSCKACRSYHQENPEIFGTTVENLDPFSEQGVLELARARKLENSSHDLWTF